MAQQTAVVRGKKMTGKYTTVMVIGTGTIGEPLIGLLSANKKQLGIDRVFFHKRTPSLLDRSKVQGLIKKGAEFVTDPDRKAGFKDVGLQPTYLTEEAIAEADVVIDCTPKGVGIENKRKYYEKYSDQAKGFIAQGSEFGFGIPYARGVNDDALKPGEDKFIQVVSCNTHTLAVIVKAIALSDGGAKNLERGRFVCIRRANDVSQADDYLASPEVDKHKDAQFGTHHARDVYHLYKTVGMELNLFSSAIKVPTQYMHTIHFSLRLKNPTTIEQVIERFKKYPYGSVTYKQLVNLVYSFGRDHGHWGRLLDEAILSIPSLWVSPEGKEVSGFCFTPQDGNSLLSSISATAFLLDPTTYKEKMRSFDELLYKEI